MSEQIPLRKIPDTYLTYYMTTQIPKPLVHEIREVKINASGTISKRIKHTYSEQYWKTGCIAAEEPTHDSYQKRHIGCNMCGAKYHSKFELKHHKREVHSY